MENKKREYKYFLYSQAMEIMRTEAESKINKQFVLGNVLVNGSWKPFTQLSSTPDNVAYADSKLVAKGYIDEMQYTLPKTEWKGVVLK